MLRRGARLRIPSCGPAASRLVTHTEFGSQMQNNVIGCACGCHIRHTCIPEATRLSCAQTLRSRFRGSKMCFNVAQATRARPFQLHFEPAAESPDAALLLRPAQAPCNGAWWRVVGVALLCFLPCLDCAGAEPWLRARSTPACQEMKRTLQTETRPAQGQWMAAVRPADQP